MREIKFRAWHPEEKKMWLDVGTDGSGCIILDTEFMQLKNLKGKAILMQYTGLKDKNGTEIYEGDIVRGFEKESGFPPYDSTLPRVVEFRNGCWCFNADRYDDGDWIRFGFWTHSNEGKNQLKQLEVVGNIYENKDLLEANNGK